MLTHCRRAMSKAVIYISCVAANGLQRSFLLAVLFLTMWLMIWQTCHLKVPIIITTNNYDGQPTHNRTPAPARTFKAATANKPNKNQKQPHATQGHPNKIDGNPYNQNNQRKLQ